MYFVISLGFLIHNLITLNGLFFANIPSVTFPYNEYWRIFTAPFATLDGVYGVVSVIIAFWWLCSLFPGYVKNILNIGKKVFKYTPSSISFYAKFISTNELFFSSCDISKKYIFL